MTSAEWMRFGFCQDQPVALPELISALSFALDLTEGAAPGHGLRCCLLGMRLARARGLDERQLTPLYYALQLNDIGCSNNAARMTEVVGGDDRAVAQDLDVFATVDGQNAAMTMLHSRRGSWFDPHLVDTVAQLHREGQLWPCCRPFDTVEETRRAVMELEPQSSGPLSADDIDTICEGFAGVVDAKSPFTYRHSIRVAEVADALAGMLQLAPARRKIVHRAALLHDIGKLSVPNTILDKPGPLNAREWSIVETHPRMTRSVLERVSAFRELAIIAAEHHERLDGSGYPWGLTAADLSLESRLLAISDQFAGMTERRAYDPGYTPAEALELIRESVPAKLDATCFAALKALVRQKEFVNPPSPGGEMTRDLVEAEVSAG
jgi:putative nucleotidyltransferase with HDIG domain